MVIHQYTEDAEVEQLFKEHQRFAFYVLERWRNTIPSKYWDDAQSEALFALFKAAHKYDPARGTQFSTYAGAVINNALRMFFRKWSKVWNREISDQSVICQDQDGKPLKLEAILGAAYPSDFDRILDQEEAKRLLNKYPLLKMYYIAGTSQREIAQMRGASQSYTSRLLKRELEDLRFELEHSKTRRGKRK